MANIGIQGGNMGFANAFDNTYISAEPIQYGFGGIHIGDVQHGGITQTPTSGVGGNTMKQEASLGFGLVNLQNIYLRNINVYLI